MEKKRKYMNEGKSENTLLPSFCLKNSTENHYIS